MKSEYILITVILLWLIVSTIISSEIFSSSFYKNIFENPPNILIEEEPVQISISRNQANQKKPEEENKQTEIQEEKTFEFKDYTDLDSELFPPLKTIKPWGTKFKTRIWCLVPTLWPEKETHIRRIAETWGSYCDKTVFIISETDEESPEKIGNATFWRLDIKRPQSKGSRNIWEKVWKMWVHVYENHLLEGDWFLKIDDDSYLGYHNMKGFLQYYNPDEPHYLGHVLLHRWKNDNIAFNSGTCYALSRNAIQKLGSVLVNMGEGKGRCRTGSGFGRYCICTDRSGDEEDPTMSICLRQVGVYAGNTLDIYYRTRFHPFQPQDHKKIKRESSWFWRFQPPERPDEENCCNAHPVSFHNYKKDKYTVQWYEYDEIYNTPLDNYPIPPRPRKFLFDSEIPFTIDKFRNIERPPLGQMLFLGNRTEIRVD